METNSLQTTSAQLPETIEDLSRFVLVNEERVQALRAQIRAIRKVSLAKDVYEQKLAEAQEIGQITVEAAQKMGELLLQIQKQSGGVNQYNKEEKSNNTEKSKGKGEIISNMGIERHAAAEYQQMAQNPEAVQSAIQKAIERGDVVSRSQVMREINSLKEELRREREKKAEVKEVRVEVTPHDYQSAKSKARAYDAETGRLNRKLEEAYRRQTELEDQIRDMKHVTKEGLDQSNLSENVFYFCAICNNFIGNVGGLVWLTDRISDMPKREREMFLKAAGSFRDWASAFTANLERSMNGERNYEPDPGVSALIDKG